MIDGIEIGGDLVTKYKMYNNIDVFEANEILRQPSYAMSMIRKGKRSARGKSG